MSRPFLTLRELIDPPVLVPGVATGLEASASYGVVMPRGVPGQRVVPSADSIRRIVRRIAYSSCAGWSSDTHR